MGCFLNTDNDVSEKVEGGKGRKAGVSVVKPSSRGINQPDLVPTLS